MIGHSLQQYRFHFDLTAGLVLHRSGKWNALFKVIPSVGHFNSHSDCARGILGVPSVDVLLLLPDCGSQQGRRVDVNGFTNQQWSFG